MSVSFCVPLSFRMYTNGYGLEIRTVSTFKSFLRQISKLRRVMEPPIFGTLFVNYL